MTSKRCYLGIDVGSSECKAIVYSLEKGAQGTGSSAYPTNHPSAGWAEQDPESWYETALDAAAQAVKESAQKEVEGISIVGPAHNLALLDEDMRVIRPCIHWSDLRSAPQCRKLEMEYADRIFEVTGQVIHPSWSLPQLMWVRDNEQQNWRRVRFLLPTKDYVRFRFSGTLQTDLFDAIGTQLYDLRLRRWSEEMCSLLGLDARFLPAVRRASEVAGALKPAAAARIGIAPGAPVCVGTSDTSAEAFAIGCIAPGHGVVKLGTSACVNVVTDWPRPSRKTLTYFHVVDDFGLTVTATNSGSSSFRWFREGLLAPIANLSFDDLVSLASRAPAGCEGLVFHPYLNGERTPYWNSNLRGSFVGINSRHTVAHFARSVMEGIAFSLRDCINAVYDLGVKVESLRIIGGGSRSLLWRQIVADVLQRDLLQPQHQDAALGAALLAAVALGACASFASACEMQPEMETLHPDPSTSEVYSDAYSFYRSVATGLFEPYQADSYHRRAGREDRK
jgi:xylulokinase